MRVGSSLCILLLVLSGCNEKPKEPSSPSAPGSPAAKPEVSNSALPLKGNASIKDINGDVIDGDYRKPKTPIPWIDLTEVSLEIKDLELRVTFINGGDVPEKLIEYQSAIWTITACSPDGEHCCIFSANLIDKWYSGLQDLSDSYYHKMAPPNISGNIITASYPVNKLPKFMSSPFKWSASSETRKEKRYSDQAPKRPEKTGDPRAMIAFPQ